MATANWVRIHERSTFYAQWKYMYLNKSGQSCILLVPKTYLSIGFDSLVVNRLVPCFEAAAIQVRICVCFQ